MKYKIYQLVNPEHLQTTELDGYYMKTINRSVLEEVNIGFESEFNSHDEAIQYIKDNDKDLICTELCILPIVRVDYEGKVD